MNKSAMFMVEAINIFENTDFKRLHQSLNGGDEAYGGEVREKLKVAHLRLLGEYPVQEEENKLVPFPAKFTEHKTDTVFLGLCSCRVFPLEKDSFIFKMLHGHLVQCEEIRLPRGYEITVCQPSDLLRKGNVTVTVYSGDREINHRLADGFAEEELAEEMEADDEEQHCLSQ